MLSRGIRTALRATTILLAAAAPLSTATAQEDDGDGETVDALDAGVEFGGGLWRVGVGAVYVNTDNFYNQESRGEAASGALLRPKVSYLTEAGRVAIDSLVSGEYGTFDIPGSADDYFDARFTGRLGYQGGTRHSIELTAGLQHDHDEFGVNRTEDATVRDASLDRWNQGRGRLRYRFGAAGAAVNAEIAVNALHKAYITNRTATEPLNYDALGAEYLLAYNYSPKSSVLFEVTRTDVNFDTAFGGGAEHRDGTLLVSRVGARWLATAKTAGDVRAGVRRRSFDNGADTLAGFDWQVGVQWSARPKTLLALRSGRAETESYLASSRLIDLKSVSLTWTQTITARIKSGVTLDNTRAEFIGTSRRDDIYAGILNVDYLVRRYLYVEARAEYVERDSNAADRDYDRLNSYIGIRFGR